MGNGIGWAVKQLWDGQRVARSGWNGKNMYLFMVKDWDARPGINMPSLPFVAMKTANGAVVPWLCSQTDLLATDWEIVDPKPDKLSTVSTTADAAGSRTAGLL